MDGGWADYKRSLSGFSGFDAGISTLKARAVADKTKVFEMDKLNLGDAVNQIGGIKSTLDTVGESAGGLATTMLSVRSFGAMKTHLKNISDKIGGKESNEEVGEKNSTAENEAPTEPEGNATGDAPSESTRVTPDDPDYIPRGQRDAWQDDDDLNYSGEGPVEGPSGAMERPLVQSETTIPDTELGAGTEATTEPSGFGGSYDPNTQSFELSNQANQGLEDFPVDDESEGITASEGLAKDPSVLSGAPTDTGLDVAGDVAGDVGAEVATDTAVIASDTAIGLGAQVLDAIPIVGEIIGAVVGIGSAIAGGIEAGKEATDEEQASNDSKAELSISGAQSVANKFGNSVTPTLTSLAQMPSNAGVF